MTEKQNGRQPQFVLHAFAQAAQCKHKIRLEVNNRSQTEINHMTLTPNIKEQILLSCPHTFLIKVLLLKCQENSPWVRILMMFLQMVGEKWQAIDLSILYKENYMVA